MKNLRLSLLALSLLGCMDGTGETDELAAEDADLGELGAADAAGGLYTYYTLRQDFRRCIYPLCGGYWVSRVNRASTTCADGSRAAECYVAEIDYSAMGLTDEEQSALRGSIDTGRAVLRGDIVPANIGDYDVARLAITEGWTAPRDFVADGVFVRVEDSGVRCITYPCESMHEAKLNSSLDADIAEIDFSHSGATDEEIAAAQEALFTDGLLIAGYRYSVRGPGGRARARTATAFYSRFTHRAPASDCVVTGCSGQVCAAEPVITTCEWQPQYECYRSATCERQPGGECGWTETPELDACLAGSI